MVSHHRLSIRMCISMYGKFIRLELNCSYTEVKTSTLTPLQDIRAEPSTEYYRVSDTWPNRVAEPIIGSALQDMDA